jgi:hypothetical protein
MKLSVLIGIISLACVVRGDSTDDYDDCELLAFKTAIQFDIDNVTVIADQLMNHKNEFGFDNFKSKCDTLLGIFNTATNDALKALTNCPESQTIYKIPSLSINFVCSLNKTNAESECIRQFQNVRK